jgi:hypothetical protein
MNAPAIESQLLEWPAMLRKLDREDPSYAE